MEVASLVLTCFLSLYVVDSFVQLNELTRGIPGENFGPDVIVAHAVEENL